LVQRQKSGEAALDRWISSHVPDWQMNDLHRSKLEKRASRSRHAREAGVTMDKTLFKKSLSPPRSAQ
jgi:hypothetical protein